MDSNAAAPSAERGSPRQSWQYGGLSSLSVSSPLEDHLFFAVQKLTSRLDVAGVCEAVLTGVEAVFGATSSWIMLYDEEREVLRTESFRGVAAEVYRNLEIPIGPGTVLASVFINREIVFVPDVLREGGWYNRARIHESGLRSIFALPLIVDDTAIGVIGLDSPRFGGDCPPDALAIKRLGVFAAQAAIGLTNARLYEQSEHDRARLHALVREKRVLRGRVSELKAEVQQAGGFEAMIGVSAPSQRVLNEIAQVAGSDVTVLLLGETGTGKELAARALHAHSRRSNRAFVAVNCAALPEHLIESEMFGYERGAFTGAHSRKSGRFELAHRGTLFLDEVGDLPAAAQAKLLRALQDGHVQRVGGTQDIVIDARVVAATNQDLLTRVADKRFREDLYYRLNVFPIQLPPLRERREDIPVLAKHFAVRFAGRLGKRIEGIEEAALEKLSTYSWPGNIRELQNVIERAVILATAGVIMADGVRVEERAAVSAGDVYPPTAVSGSQVPTVRSLVDVERAAIAEAIRAAQGRISGPRGAAALLGLKPTTLHAKMKKLGVHRDDVLTGS
jgi:formate hydrogenlyase transcriptional activator